MAALRRASSVQMSQSFFVSGASNAVFAINGLAWWLRGLCRMSVSALLFVSHSVVPFIKKPARGGPGYVVVLLLAVYPTAASFFSGISPRVFISLRTA